MFLLPPQQKCLERIGREEHSKPNSLTGRPLKLESVEEK